MREVRDEEPRAEEQLAAAWQAAAADMPTIAAKLLEESHDGEERTAVWLNRCFGELGIK